MFVQNTLPDTISQYIRRHAKMMATITDGDMFDMAYKAELASYGVRVNVAVVIRMYDMADADVREKYRWDNMTAIMDHLNEKEGVYAHPIGCTHLLLFFREQPMGQLQITINPYSMYLHITTDRDNLDLLRRMIEDIVPESTHVGVSTCVLSNNNIALRKNIILKPNNIQNYHSLYPFLAQSPKAFYDGFMASNSNVSLLIGPPGTGKSSYLRQLIEYHTQRDMNVVICDNDNVSKNPYFIDKIRDSAPNTLIIVEDADHLIERRTDGNKHMAGLLNLTSGALDARIKIVITTNLPNVNSVDEALLRKGRTYKQLEFKKLKGTQVNDARMAIGLSPVNIDTENECSGYTLAEALNFEEGDDPQQGNTTNK